VVLRRGQNRPRPILTGPWTAGAEAGSDRNLTPSKGTGENVARGGAVATLRARLTETFKNENTILHHNVFRTNDSFH